MSALPDQTHGITDDLARQGWALVPDYLAPSTVQCLREEAKALYLEGTLQQAGIGQGMARTINHDIRGDAIHWLEESSASAAQRAYLDSLEMLRQSVNRDLQLGLFEFEGHFALYPPGAFYRRHLDRFQNSSQRTLTCILYLNQDWNDQDGGQLRVYTDGDAHFDVLPRGGTLFTFLSERFWHEVLPAQRERISLTGWFKTRDSGMP